ncbi:hypothetical protein [Nocardia sp. NPDC058705]|uniref:hypothetical protein n=1 Tax=Nocardia sp. NPDC058705 TaxID=3346609 RepID=UPI0036CA11CE
MGDGGVAPLRRPVPRWWTIIIFGVTGLVIVDCLWLLWQNMVDGRLSVTGSLLFGLLALGVCWLVVAAVGMIAYRQFVMVAVAPAVVVLTGLLGWFGVPEQFGWLVSKSHFEQAAQTCDETTAGHRIGVFTVEAVQRKDGGCLFRTPGGFVGGSGFAYLPGGAPPKSGEYDERYRPYDGVWYRYSLS